MEKSWILHDFPPTKSTDHFRLHRPSSSTKLISFTNGSFIKPQYSHHNHHQQQLVIRNPVAYVVVVVVVYKECLKNHAASLGGRALDGCGDLMPSLPATPTDPASLKCVVCGCHRNFQRRDPDFDLHLHQPGIQIVELHHQHQHTTTTTSSSPRDHSPSPNFVSPPPISSSYNFPANSAPHMLLALSVGHVSPGPPPPPPPDPHQHTTTVIVMTTSCNTNY